MRRRSSDGEPDPGIRARAAFGRAVVLDNTCVNLPISLFCGRLFSKIESLPNHSS